MESLFLLNRNQLEKLLKNESSLGKEYLKMEEKSTFVYQALKLAVLD